MDKTISEFCRTHKRIFIYGAGAYGIKALKILKAQGKIVSGFIDRNESIKLWSGCNVYNPPYFRNKILEEHDGIIIAVKQLSPDETGITTCDIVKYDDLSLYRDYFDFILESTDKMFPFGKKIKAKNETASRILVCHLQRGIGDFVCSTPFLRELRRSFPCSEITLLMRQSLKDLAVRCPYVNRLVFVDDGNLCNEDGIKLECLKDEITYIMKLDGLDNKYDMAFLCHETLMTGGNEWRNFTYAMMTSNYVVGYVLNRDNGSRYIYEKLCDLYQGFILYESPLHVVDAQLGMLRSLGKEAKDGTLELWPLAEYPKRFMESMHSQKKNIAVGLAASRGQRAWGHERYEEFFCLCARFHPDWNLMLIGDSKVKNMAYRLCANSSYTVQDLTGKLSLEELVSSMRLVDLYVGPDTGLAHIATAEKIPSVVIFSTLSDSRNDFEAGPLKWGSRRPDSFTLEAEHGMDGCAGKGICKMKYPHCINQIEPRTVIGCMETIFGKGASI